MSLTCEVCGSTVDVRPEVTGATAHYPPDLTFWDSVLYDGPAPLPKTLYCRECSRKDEEWWDREYAEVFGYPLR